MTKKKKRDGFIKRVCKNTVKTIKDFWNFLSGKDTEVSDFYRKMAAPIAKPVGDFIVKKWAKAPKWLKKIAAVFKPFTATIWRLVELYINAYILLPIVYTVKLILMVIEGLKDVCTQFILDAKEAAKEFTPAPETQ